VDVSVRRAGAVTVLDLRGKVTLGVGIEALRAGVEGVAAKDAKILVNLAEVPYIDSAGLGGLVRCQKIAADAGAEIKLLNPAKRVYDLLHAVKLHQFFETFHDEATAIASFGA
jgi:anti-sigma B factor antagonist